MAEIKKGQIEKIINIPGKVRGVVLKTDAEYVREKKGEEGLAALREELKKIDCPIDYENIKATRWYPLGLRLISLLAIKKVFNFGDKEIEDMGNAAPKYSFVVKSLLKYFLSPSMTYKESPKYWEKHYTVGKLETPDLDLKKKYFVICIKDFTVHPILCIYLAGYFLRMGQLVLKGDNFKVKETNCAFKGHSFHEYLITWE